MALYREVAVRASNATYKASSLLNSQSYLCRRRFQRSAVVFKVSICPLDEKFSRRRVPTVFRASQKDLVALGLSNEQMSRVVDLIEKTGVKDVEKSVTTLTAFVGSTTAARELVIRHPHLLCCQLPSWVEFLMAFGLNKAQIQHVLCQTPEALIEGDLVRAGRSILTFRRLGLTDYAAAQLVTYYPQLLSKDEEDIRAVLSLLGRYQTSIDTSGC